MVRRIPATIALTSALLLAPAALAQNHAANPDFDRDEASWIIAIGDSPTWVEAADADGCYGSGSLQVGSAPADGDMARLDQCVPLAGDGTFTARLLYRMTSQGFHTIIEVKPSPDGSCGSAPWGYSSSGFGDPAETWTPLSISGPLPEGAQSIKFEFLAFDSGSNTPFDLDVDRIWVGGGDPIFWDDFEARSTCRWSTVAVPCDTGYLFATSFDQGAGVGPLPIDAHGAAWVTFSNAVGSHQIFLSNGDDNVDLAMDVWYPAAGFDGCSPPDFTWNDQGTGVGLYELHSTTLAGVAPIPSGNVYIRARNLADSAGTFGVFDSD